MDVFTQLVLVIGRINSDGIISMLGTGFIVSNDGKIVTSRHVVADNDENLIVLLPYVTIMNEYQDTTDTKCSPVQAYILESDPFRDITIIKSDLNFNGNILNLGSFDDVNVGEQVCIIGFPHCV